MIKNFSQFFTVFNTIFNNFKITKNRIVSVFFSVELKDGTEVEQILKETGFTYWKSLINQNNRKPQICITIKDESFNEFLSKMNYKNKSKESPELILDKIPKELHYAFFLGLSDADGCFYIHKKRFLY